MKNSPNSFERDLLEHERGDKPGNKSYGFIPFEKIKTESDKLIEKWPTENWAVTDTVVEAALADQTAESLELSEWQELVEKWLARNNELLRLQAENKSCFLSISTKLSIKDCKVEAEIKKAVIPTTALEAQNLVKDYIADCARLTQTIVKLEDQIKNTSFNIPDYIERNKDIYYRKEKN